MDFAAYAHLWILFSLLSAFFHASRLAVTKHLSLTLSARALTLYVNLASLLVTLPLVIWSHQFPVDDPVYLGAVLLGGLLSGLGGWSLNVAIKRSEVSLVGPILTLTPAFVIVIEWLLTDTLPGPFGFVGIGLLIIGSYVLSLGAAEEDWYQPLLRLVTNPGSAFTLTATGCFAAASTLGRIGIERSDPLSFAVVVAVVNPLVLFTLFSLQDRRFYREVLPPDLARQTKPLLLLGLLFALMRLADQIALSMTLASYAMAVKRAAGMFSVLIGRWCFAEGGTRTKLIGSAIMLFGLFVLTQL
ncbi:DMT family transporter [Halochromatium salexigens]|uniref:EamA family transporter n=1 Tax=Halochromatium salexigens TaxID=49447 RepID=A0AAJ0UGA0_HALSE|nr:DMT family transporter [Halochromatium salexigens]MBK5930903.1 EamA family transporter [Halochromatium salexigens]